MLKDIIDNDLRILFCGINPGLSSAQLGYPFANPTNRFWQVIYQAGFTERLLKPHEASHLLDTRCGITAFVKRPTVNASELSTEEFRQGGEVLTEKVRKYQPEYLAVLGKQAFVKAFRLRKADWGLQPQTIDNTKIWLLPNPSGLNRATMSELIEAYKALNEYAVRNEKG